MIISIGWEEVLVLGTKDPNNSFNRLQDAINPVIDRYQPLNYTENSLKQRMKL